MIDLTTYALLRKQITSVASGVSDVRAEGDELVFVLEDGREVRVAIPATEIRDAVVRDDVLVLTLENDKEVVVDATLTQSGHAADAKVTGDVVSQLKSDISNMSEVIVSPNIYDETECTNGYMDTFGRVYTSETLKYTPKIPVETGDVIRAYKNSSNGLVPTNMKFITAFLSTTGNASTYHGGTNVSEFTIVGSTNKIVITADENVDEITINHQPTSYEPKHDPYRVIKDSALPKASETNFGVAKMWVTVDEGGNKVLNISTGDENE